MNIRPVRCKVINISEIMENDTNNRRKRKSEAMEYSMKRFKEKENSFCFTEEVRLSIMQFQHKLIIFA